MNKPDNLPRSQTMGMDKLDDLEIAALLSSKICHDIISPVGAIANGLEVLDEDCGEEMRGEFKIAEF